MPGSVNFLLATNCFAGIGRVFGRQRIEVIGHTCNLGVVNIHVAEYFTEFLFTRWRVMNDTVGAQLYELKLSFRGAYMKSLHSFCDFPFGTPCMYT
jgi:hypothetical protein